MNAANTWSYLAPRLQHAGFRVFAFNYGRDTSSLAGKPRGVYGTAGLLEAQREVAAFIDGVLEQTGAQHVDLVGHSQGVAQARLYLTESGGADLQDPSRNRVRTIVGIGGCNHGTTLSGVIRAMSFLDRNSRLDNPARRFLGAAALDQRVGSEAIEHMNRYGDTVPGVDYTMICSRFDQVVTPWRSQLLHGGPDATVRNVVVQTGNVKDFSDHLTVLYSPTVLALVLEALGAPEDYLAANPPSSRMVLPGLGELPAGPGLPSRWRPAPGAAGADAGATPGSGTGRAPETTPDPTPETAPRTSLNAGQRRSPAADEGTGPSTSVSADGHADAAGSASTNDERPLLADIPPGTTVPQLPRAVLAQLTQLLQRSPSAPSRPRARTGRWWRRG